MEIHIWTPREDPDDQNSVPRYPKEPQDFRGIRNIHVNRSFIADFQDNAFKRVRKNIEIHVSFRTTGNMF